MVRRPGDTFPEPPGGRAAERLQMFQEARQPKGASEAEKKKPAGAKKTVPDKKRGTSDAKQDPGKS